MSMFENSQGSFTLHTTTMGGKHMPPPPLYSPRPDPARQDGGAGEAPARWRPPRARQVRPHLDGSRKAQVVQ